MVRPVRRGARQHSWQTGGELIHPGSARGWNGDGFLGATYDHVTKGPASGTTTVDDMHGLDVR